MAKTLSNSTRPTCLSEILAEQPEWSLADCLLLIRRLTEKVRGLHRHGQTHRAVDAEHVSLDQGFQPELLPPPAVRCFGGEDSDPDFCPLELCEEASLELPLDIDAAATALRRRDLRLDPRRIDIYQLGTLFCRLLTNQPVQGFMFSARVKSQVPEIAQPILQGALGYDASNRFEDCEALITALDKAIPQAGEDGTRSSSRETPAEGSVLLPSRDTPPDGHGRPASSAAKAQPADVTRFERLAHFRILERIGSGGMGDVYRAYDESLERQVAIKVLPAELARDRDFVRRFHSEATAAAKVTHPNVVPVHFTGEDAGYHFFVMQFVQGESLSERMKRCGRLPAGEALEIVAQCLAGLEAAHRQGLIHRDVKPGNVLLEREGDRALLVDFGLVHRIGSSERMTATGTVMGTVDYIAPEQARGQEVDGRADIYSLGVMTYQLLSGRLPFQAETPTAMIFQHAYEDPFPLMDAAPEVPQPVIDIVTRMMAKSTEDRYSSCAEVLADIRAYGEGRPVASAQRVAAGTKTTTTLPAPDLPEDIRLPEGLEELARQRRWQPARDWLATMFHRHAPEFVQDLHSTTQQVDGAVAHYERHRERLARLYQEAQSLAAELAEQLAINVAAVAAARRQVESATDHEAEQAARARKQECEEHVEVLRRQHDEQQRQLEEIEHQLGRADAKLVQLRSQRDVLKARLRAAEARQQLEGGRPRVAGHRRMLRAMIAGGLMALLILSLVIFLSRPDRRQRPTTIMETAPSLASGTVSGPAPPLAVAPFDAARAKDHQEAWAKHLGQPVEMTNGVGMKLVLLPPGEFQMGATQAEIDQAVQKLQGQKTVQQLTLDMAKSAGPRHRVTISRPFYLGVCEVTQFEYGVVMGRNPSTFFIEGGEQSKVSGQDTSRFPVESVSWGDAQEFCHRLSSRPAEAAARRTYRLPTEAEWEYACRAGTTAPCSFGEDLGGLNEHAWCGANAGGIPHPTGTKKANPWGLYDMYGNVAEFCADLANSDYYQPAAAVDPQGPQSGSWPWEVKTGNGSWVPSRETGFRIVRGNHWRCPPWPTLLNSSAREAMAPGVQQPWLGFRVVCEIAEGKHLAVQVRSVTNDPNAHGPLLTIVREEAEKGQHLSRGAPPLECEECGVPHRPVQ